MHGIKIRKKYEIFFTYFGPRNIRKHTHFSLWLSLNISLIFLPTRMDYHLKYLSYYSKKRKVHKVALSLRKAMNIIKRRKIENTVTFNISSPTKEFRSTGKCFPYVVSIIYFNEFILICQKILLSMVPLVVKLPIHCLSSMFIPIESLGLGLLIRRSV